jgi:hypothetical protein
VTRFRSRRWLPLPRVLVLGLFALALVLQPVMAAAGEMHELAHDPSGAHSHVHADDGDTHSIASSMSDDSAETLHVLLDFAHCCGATPAMVPSMKSLCCLPSGGPLAISKAAMPPATRLPAPFKPPIFA